MLPSTNTEGFQHITEQASFVTSEPIFEGCGSFGTMVKSENQRVEVQAWRPLERHE